MTSRDVIRLTAADYGITPDELLDHRRVEQLVEPRRVAMWLCRKMLRLSFPETGRAFNRDHTTVIKAMHAIETQWSRYAERIERLRVRMAEHMAHPLSFCASCGTPLGERARQLAEARSDLAALQKRIGELETAT